MAVQGLLCFPADCRTFCSGSVKDAIGHLIVIESVDSIQSEVSQEEKNKYIKAYIWNLEKWY